MLRLWRGWYRKLPMRNNSFAELFKHNYSIKVTLKVKGKRLTTCALVKFYITYKLKATLQVHLIIFINLEVDQTSCNTTQKTFPNMISHLKERCFLKRKWNAPQTCNPNATFPSTLEACMQMPPVVNVLSHNPTNIPYIWMDYAANELRTLLKLIIYDDWAFIGWV